MKAVIVALLLLLAACAPIKEMSEQPAAGQQAQSTQGMMDMTGEEKHELTEYVTEQYGTEPAFNNAYWDEHRPGIYVDVNTGEPLFSSLDKFDSGTGWPSFTKPLAEANIEEKEDNKLLMKRTEVRTEASHLGHVFDDGPDGGDRYCINSASLLFVPYEELASKGLEQYEALFPYKKATFAGGCFWGVEHLLKVDGVIATTAGYTGGNTEEPTYTQVSSGKTGHAEAVEVVFDPGIISYEELLDLFWRLHDPTQKNRQGPDIGTQYRSAIFYHDEEQKRLAEESKTALDASGTFAQPVVTEIVPAKPFYSAEDYHQDYVEKNPGYICHTLRE